MLHARLLVSSKAAKRFPQAPPLQVPAFRILELLLSVFHGGGPPSLF